MEWWFYGQSWVLWQALCVFGFPGDFEKVPMEEDAGHGGMIIKCWCYFDLECCLCAFGKLVGRKFWRFWLWCGWIKWVAEYGPK
jgi:hypothetical protein